MRFLYSLALLFYHKLISIASWFNPKAKAWKTGRKDWEIKILDAKRKSSKPIIWLHCASYGEYLQALPLIKQMSASDVFKSHALFLSFFSPSGMNNYQDIPEVEHVFYLPLDVKKNSKKLVQILSPKLFIGVKYELWINLIESLKAHGATLILIAANFRRKQMYFQPYGKKFLKALKCFDKIYTQYEDSAHLLNKYSIEAECVGDPRFDQALENVSKEFSNEVVNNFVDGQNIVVFASVWQHEVRLVANLLKSGFKDKIILAPHEIAPLHLKKMLRPLVGKYGLLSNKDVTKQILVIDKIGELRYLFRYAKYVFVGGGFKGALHNILEPAAYGVPVFHGGPVKKYPEHKALSKAGAGRMFLSTDAAENYLLNLNDAELENMSVNAKKWVNENKGSAEKINSSLLRQFISIA